MHAQLAHDSLLTATTCADDCTIEHDHLRLPTLWVELLADRIAGLIPQQPIRS